MRGGGEEEVIIVVAVDASKEMTDYALEWAFQNVIKSPSIDFLILLLAILPLSNPLPPSSNHQTNNYHSTLYQFLSGLLNKKEKKTRNHEQGGSSDEDCNNLAGSDSVVVVATGDNNDDDDVPNTHNHTKRINKVCVQMMQQQLLSLPNPMLHQVHAEVKVVADAQMGSIAMVAQELGAMWVILDRRLKKEADCCVKQLTCNVILVDHAIPNILSSKSQPLSRVSKFDIESHPKSSIHKDHFKKSSRVTKFEPPKTSPHLNSHFWGYEAEQTDEAADSYSIPLYSSKSQPLSKVSKFDIESPPNPSSIHKDQFKKSSPGTKFKPPKPHLNSHFSDHKAEQTDEAAYSSSIPLYSSKSQPLSKVSDFDIEDSAIDKKTRSYSSVLKTRSDVHRSNNRVKEMESSSASFPPPRSSDSPNSSQKLKYPNRLGQPSKRRESTSSKANDAVPFPPKIDRVSSVRRAISLSIKQPPTPPPLCSICKHNAPIFGKAPRRFSYEEMERATNGFSADNFLAEGGYGPVYRGVLPDGLVVAVKQHKMLSAQGASEFCSEVEVLSCAQHKNLVMLVGYCIQTEWLLVYEFACNGSLDKHLYGGKETNEVMAWHNRMKVAGGAARGLRYLHEDCRVGCIVHRDFRPNNILLTHDFEPMVGDFGLARWQVDGQSAEETRVIGAFGYLAPEYTEMGMITEKADVYAFGVVLLELLTGIEATKFSRKHLQEQAINQGRSRDTLRLEGSSLLEKKIYNEIIDARLENNYVEKEAECMFQAAILCISPHPKRRPRISEVLKILEGDMPTYTASHRRQSRAVYPKQRLDGYDTDELWYQMLDDNLSQLTRSIHGMNLSPSRKNSADKNTNNGQKRKSKPTTPLDRFKIVNGGWDSNQTELIVNQEYQEHLQGSLSKFIENIVVNCKVNEKGEIYVV
ncbi:hypothetical protein HYC85_014164 [Camellia sinensis]|uniref:Protein kinase domain-containing protein n=1 Tax=Camellia sinensis TaxID=4442 RepID=A0A7J7H6Q2_CAMSI|nr:hypothetical protein HYC85_014164 [Camellia sinensis]